MELDYQMRTIMARVAAAEVPLNSTRVVYEMHRPQPGPGAMLQTWSYLQQEVPRAAFVLRESLAIDNEPDQLHHQTLAAAELEAEIRGNTQINTHHYLIAYLGLSNAIGVSRLEAAGLVVPYLVFQLRMGTGRGLHPEERLTLPEGATLPPIADVLGEVRNSTLNELTRVETWMQHLNEPSSFLVQEAIALHRFKGQDLHETLLALYEELASLHASA